MSRAHFRSGLVPENKRRSSLSITDALGSFKVKRCSYGGNGTGTKDSGTSTPRLLVLWSTSALLVPVPH